MLIKKEIELKDAEFKYGFKNKGIFAKEKIKRGELIFECDETICDYYKSDESYMGKTREETLEIFKQYPNSADFIKAYMYMVEDDLYDWPHDFVDKNIHENCMFVNHSCDPNCGFYSNNQGFVIAIKDIEIGEELTYDYQIMDTEASFYTGLECKCGSSKCRGKLTFDMYRNIDWQAKLYDFSSPYIRRKINELKTKWHSSSCYLKFYKNDQLKEKRKYALTVLKKVDKDELVAKFFDKSQIERQSHYIRDSKTPTCYLIGQNVFTLNSYEPDVELTLDYSNINKFK